MIFFKKIWFFALLGFIVFGVGIHIFLRGRTPPEPVRIYKATQPIPKPRAPQTDTDATQPPITHYHTHDHPHEHGSHDHAAGTTPKPDKYDWRDDSTIETPLPTNDPWKNVKAQQTDQEVSDSEVPQIDPPPNWHLTEDPKQYAEYFRAQLIKQFGDRPEVHTLADTALKIRQDMPLTRDEYIADLEAQYALWPDPRTLRALKEVRTIEDASFIRFEESQE